MPKNTVSYHKEIPFWGLLETFGECSSLLCHNVKFFCSLSEKLALSRQAQCTC